MKRREFLKFLGGVALASVAAKDAIARSFAALQGAGRLPEVEGEAALRSAIEALFPAGVIPGAITAYANFDRKNRMLEPGDDDGRYAFTRIVFDTFRIGYMGEDEANGRLHRALYRSMYREWEEIAERPENRHAILVWRVTPTEVTGPIESGEEMVSLRLRAGLLQQGWRRRLQVEAWMGGRTSFEGEPTRMLVP